MAALGRVLGRPVVPVPFGDALIQVYLRRIYLKDDTLNFHTFIEEDFLEREEMLTVIDALHKAVILRDRGDMKALETHLALNGGDQETFRLVTQAAADLLPSGNREQQLLQGLLLHLKNRRTVGSMQTDMLGSQE